MAVVKITTKSQATLPRELCEEMGLSPGDSTEVLPIVHDGRRVWTMRPVRTVDLSFFVCLRPAKSVSAPATDRVRDEIVKAMKERGLD